MPTIPFSEVMRIRAQIAHGHTIAAERFRHLFASDPLLHLELQAAALLETSRDVSVAGGRVIRYSVDGAIVTPYAEPGKPIHLSLKVIREPAALLEYWLIASELTASAAWAMTRLIVDHGEYDDALRRMRSPQIVKALIATFLPSVHLREDGTALLEVVVYARAGEERVERRSILIDRQNELHFHGRDLIAEGKGGIRIEN
ncbi:MAG: hypothetical protein ABI837_04970 [Acidobacteriota bacterium]